MKLFGPAAKGLMAKPVVGLGAATLVGTISYGSYQWKNNAKLLGIQDKSKLLPGHRPFCHSPRFLLSSQHTQS